MHADTMNDSSDPFDQHALLTQMTGISPAETWFAGKGWSPFPFQREVWAAYLAGESGLLHAATGTGKTLAVWWGPLLEWLAEHRDVTRPEPPAALQVLWITPMRALAADTERALRAVARAAHIPWTVERRTGGTAGSTCLLERPKHPSALLTSCWLR